MTERVEITSTANPQVKSVLRLRDRKERDSTGLTVVDGAREIRRALDAGVEVVQAFVHEPAAVGDDATSVLETLRGLGGWTPVGASVIDRLAFGDRSEGIVLVARQPRMRLGDLLVADDAVVAVVDGLEKPGNLGAILRSADGAGIAAVLATDPATDLYNPAAIRASIGTIFAVRVVTASAAETLTWLRRGGFRIVAARVDAVKDYVDVDLTGRTAIVLGSEATGLGEAWTEPDIDTVRLPMLGIADSLNVSATAAILFYEALRQRRPG